jgi:hypothetical protein
MGRGRVRVRARVRVRVKVRDRDRDRDRDWDCFRVGVGVGVWVRGARRAHLEVERRQRLDHRRRPQRVAGHAPALSLRCRAEGHHRHTKLAHVVGRLASVGAHVRHNRRRHRDDAPEAGGEHVRHARLRYRKRAARVDRCDQVVCDKRRTRDQQICRSVGPRFRWRSVTLLERRVDYVLPPQSARVVDEHVDPAKPCDRRVDAGLR